MTTVFSKAFLTSILLGCISCHFQGKAHATAIMNRPGNHYGYRGKDHRNRDEVLVILGMFVDEIDAPLWGGGGCRHFSGSHRLLWQKEGEDAEEVG